MRRLGMAVLFVALAGCDFGVKTCSKPGDCPTGSMCSINGFCVANQDSGTGGGGGTGGGTGGGMTGGGAGGSGGGGGSMDRCLGVTCPVGHACAPSTGACTNHVTQVQVLLPSSGGVLDSGVVTFEARLQTDGTTVELPETLATTLNSAAGPVLQRINASADYRGTQTLQDALYGLEVLFVVPDAGVSLPSDLVNFEVDTRAPTLMPLGGLPLGQLQRDDVLSLKLEADETVQANSVQVALDGVPLETETQGVCTAPAGCWKLDLSLPPLGAMEGSFALTASAADRVGNRKTTNLGMLSVTRRRWEVSLGGLEAIRASPAVGSDGTVYVGTTAAVSNSIYALNPLDGGAAHSPVAAGAVVSIATAMSNDAGVVFFSANDATGGLVGARTSSLETSAALASIARGNPATSTFAAIGLAGSPSHVGALAAFSSLVATPGLVVAYWSSASSRSTSDAAPVNAFDFSSSANEPPNNIIVNGTTAYLLTKPGNSGLFRRSITGVQPGSNLSDGTSQTIAATGSTALTFGQSAVGGDSLVGGTGSLSSIYRLGATVDAGNLGLDGETGMSSFSGTKAFAGRETSLVAYDPGMLAGPATTLFSGVGTIRTSPVLGAPRPNATEGLGYAVSSSGQLWVFPQDGVAFSAVAWGGVFTGANTVLAHPNLDCNRRTGSAAATTGILYVASSQGRVAAIIVDSPKLLATPGAWPRYQRTAGNAGNPAFPLNPGCP